MWSFASSEQPKLHCLFITDSAFAFEHWRLHEFLSIFCWLSSQYFMMHSIHVISQQLALKPFSRAYVRFPWITHIWIKQCKCEVSVQWCAFNNLWTVWVCNIMNAVCMFCWNATIFNKSLLKNHETKAWSSRRKSLGMTDSLLKGLARLQAVSFNKLAQKGTSFSLIVIVVFFWSWYVTCCISI